MLIAPPEAEVAAHPGSFGVVVRPEDFVFAACHEGVNRSQVRLSLPCAAVFISAGDCRLTSRPCCVLVHGCVGGEAVYLVLSILFVVVGFSWIRAAHQRFGVIEPWVPQTHYTIFFVPVCVREAWSCGAAGCTGGKRAPTLFRGALWSQ